MEVQTEYVSGDARGETVITSAEDMSVENDFFSHLKSFSMRLSKIFVSRKRLPNRIRLRRKLLLLLAPFDILLLVLIIKFYILIPASRDAQNQFNVHHSNSMAAPISHMRFLFTISRYIPEMAEGDKSILENNLQAADQHFSAALRHGGTGRCPILLNSVIVKEALGEFDVRSGHFSHAMQETNDALRLLQTAPRICIEDSNDENKERHQYIISAKTRLNREFNQADQGTLFFSKVGDHYQFYYIGNKGTQDIKYTGQGNKCAHLSDKPKAVCIIKDDKMKRPPPDQPPPSKDQDNNQSNPPPPPPKPNPEPLPSNPKTSSPPPPKLDQNGPDQHNLAKHQDPKDMIGDLLSDSDGRSHTNQ